MFDRRDRVTNAEREALLDALAASLPRSFGPDATGTCSVAGCERRAHVTDLRNGRSKRFCFEHRQGGGARKKSRPAAPRVRCGVATPEARAALQALFGS